MSSLVFLGEDIANLNQGIPIPDGPEAFRQGRDLYRLDLAEKASTVEIKNDFRYKVIYILLIEFSAFKGRNEMTCE